MGILTLPNEILLNIAKNLDPNDVKNLIEACPDFVLLLIPILETAVEGVSSKCHPIYWAAYNGYVGLVKILLGNGVYNTGVRGKKGSILLRYAVRGGHVSVIKLLLDGGHVRITDDHGWPIIHTAASHGREAVIQFLLLELGVNVNQISHRNGRTALHSAASSSKTAVAEILLKNGANFEARDNYGKTALTLATMNNNLRLVRMLLKRGADVTAKDYFGWTALHRAFQSMVAFKRLGTAREIAKLLSEADVGFGSRNHDDRTPFHMVDARDSLEYAMNFLYNGIIRS